MKAPSVRADGAVAPGAGRLKIRKRKTPRDGVVTEWLFIFTAPSASTTSTMTLGKYVEAPAPGGLTIQEARAAAHELQAKVRAGINPALEREAERLQARAAQVSSVDQARQHAAKTLQALLAAYVENLRERGKESARDAENLFSNHVLAAFPDLAAAPAASVTAEHWTLILSRLVRPPAGGRVKGRTALKLRSYASAAYKLALGAGRDPMAPAAATGFGLTTNPVAAVSSTSMARVYNVAGVRVLSSKELATYMDRVAKLPSTVNRLALELQLASGGQRVQQLLRLSTQDVQEDTFTLHDPKGRRAQARRHVLPIAGGVVEPLAQLLMLQALAGAPGGALFVARSAVVHHSTLSAEVAGISAAMVKAGEASKPFKLADIRRTCETVMAETLGISKDTRAQLLSHGITGVQDVHYDKGDHLPAKTRALEAWHEHLEALRTGAAEQASNVVSINARAAA